MKKYFFLLMFLFFISFSSAALTTNLNETIKFDEGSGTTATGDVSFFNFSGSGTPGWTTNGTDNNATDLEASANEYWSLPTGAYFPNSTTPYTINLWIKPESLSGDMFVLSKSPSNSVNYQRIGLRVNNVQSNRLDYIIHSTSSEEIAFSSTSVTTGTWYMVTLRYDGSGNMTIWVNGNQEGTDSIANFRNDGESPFYIGRAAYSTPAYFDGVIDEFYYWEGYALTSSEIDDLYNSGSGLFYPFTSAPSIVVNSPANNTEVLNGTSLTFNSTSTVATGTLVNTTVYVDDVAQNTQNISGTSNTTTYSDTFTAGTHTFIIESCSDGGCTNSSEYNFEVVRAVVNSVTYTNPVSEGVSNTFTINFTNDTNVNSVTFNYSGSESIATVYPYSDYVIANYTMVSPTSDVVQNNSFNWLISYTDSFQYNTSTYYQSITDLLIGDCNTYNFTVYNFTIVDEETQTKLSPSTYNTTAQVELMLSLSDGTTIQNYSNNFNGNNSFSVCISANLSTNPEGVFIDAQIQYGADGYVKEFYNIQNENITTADLNTNITLYDLNSSTAQEFLITYTDENFNPVNDALILIKRKYISEGLFKTVEIPITDNAGETLANLVLSDVIYSFTVTKDGVLLASFDNQVAFCDNIATGDCKIQLNTYSSTSIPDVYQDTGDYYFDIDYAAGTRILTATFSVPSGAAATNLLNVTLLQNDGVTNVCSDTSVTASGTLSCTVPSNYENSTIIAELTKDGTLVGRAIIDLAGDPDEIYGNSRIFIAISLFLMVIGIGIVDSPAVLGILMILGTILLVVFNLINSGPAGSLIGATATVLFYIVSIIFILIKGGNKR
jgi:hypothetical protein